VNSATREIFGNIPPWQHYIFYSLATISMAIFAFGVIARMRRWTRGKITWRLELAEIKRRIPYFVTQVFAQPRLRKEPSSGAMHLFIFWGFLFLFVGTNIVAVQHYGPISFFHGIFYLIFKVVMNVFGLLMLVGVGVALYRRYVVRPKRIAGGSYGLALAFLGVLGVTGFLLEGFRMAARGYYGWYDWSPGGAVVASLLQATGASQATLTDWHRSVWWFHAVVTFTFIALIPYTRLLHMITAPLNIFFVPLRPKGALTTPFRLEDLEAGAATMVAPKVAADLMWQQLLGADACTECGLCQEVCPAYASERPLSPKQLILSLRDGVARNGSAGIQTQIDEMMSPISSWSCTNCRACMEACPVSIQHIDLIIDVRRKQVADSRLDANMVNTLTNLRRTGNPYGMPAEQRLAWTSGLPVSVKVDEVQTESEFEVLYWVGCAGAFDDRGRRVARAVATLLQRAGVKFKVLGPQERCSGDPARRLGEEGLFQEFARDNIRNLGRYGVKKIITQCPHCFNTLKNEYPDFGGHYEVLHHSEFISGLIADGRLKVEGDHHLQSVTYHDSCFLGRHNDVYSAPREALKSVPGLKLIEMPRNQEKSFCCGAGGANMWFDVGVGKKINNIRYGEAITTGAEVIATACPFCMTMFDDAQSSKGASGMVQIRDISEILVDGTSG
jgi:Fe-S oxidoreductase/nitrate reductase gamma subunit